MSDSNPSSQPDESMDDEFSQLLEAVANRELTADQQARLAARLERDANARAAFVSATAMEAMLAHEFPMATDIVSSAGLSASTTDLPEKAPRGSRPATSSSKAWVALAVLSMASSVILAITLWGPASAPPFVAEIASSENAAWESTLPTTEGSQLLPGKLGLRGGIATIRFQSGAAVTLEAPAEFEIVSEMRGKLMNGAAVIDVPEAAIGFVVETPDGFAVDYGTKFAVNVDRSSQRSDFELIEGEIAVHHPSTGRELRLDEPHRVVSVDRESLNVLSVEEPGPSSTLVDNVIRIGTNGRATSVLRNNKRHKFIDPELLSVKKTNSGKWDHRSFFAFDLSGLEASQIQSARLRLNLVPSPRGLAARLPVVNRFGIYGVADPSKQNWGIDSFWEESPSNKDGALLGTFEVRRSEQRGTFGIANDQLTEFLREHAGASITLVLERITTQIEGPGRGLTHVFANDRHPEAVGPQLELTVE
ncbi:MAG: FecR domain-containing protein [Planctomycetota bacterium]